MEALSASGATKTFDVMHVLAQVTSKTATNCLALFLVLTITNSRGRCVFMAQII